MGWDCVSRRKFEEIGALFICRYHLRTRMCRCNAGWKHEQSKHYDRSLLKAIISWLAGFFSSGSWLSAQTTASVGVRENAVMIQGHTVQPTYLPTKGG